MADQREDNCEGVISNAPHMDAMEKLRKAEKELAQALRGWSKAYREHRGVQGALEKLQRCQKAYNEALEKVESFLTPGPTS